MYAVETLNAQFGIADHVTFGVGAHGAVSAVIQHADGEAEVALQGAQVLRWTPRGQAPVIWLSPAARFSAGKSLRGGVPVCWPWFGAHPEDASKPAHGFARNLPWQVVATARLADATQISLRLLPGAAQMPFWPYAAELSLQIEVGATLRLRLLTRNTGVQPFTLTQALHTYLQVGDIAQVTVEGLAGLDYIDRVPGRGDVRCQQQGAVTVAGEVDRIYLGAPGSVSVTDLGLQRRIQVSKQGSQSYVVWNPWIEKSAKFGDMGSEGYRQMLCVETTNAWDDTVTVQPGTEAVLATAYSVAAL